MYLAKSDFVQQWTSSLVVVVVAVVRVVGVVVVVVAVVVEVLEKLTCCGNRSRGGGGGGRRSGQTQLKILLNDSCLHAAATQPGGPAVHAHTGLFSS